jgi:hypothetical protein
MRTKLEFFLGEKEKLLKDQQTKNPALEKRQGRGTRDSKPKAGPPARSAPRNETVMIFSAGCEGCGATRSRAGQRLKPYWFWERYGTADGSRPLTTRAVPYKDLAGAAQLGKAAPPANKTTQAEACATRLQQNPTGCPSFHSG